MKLSKRLISISNFIDDNSKVIDVGCDHALLDIYLFKNKKNISLIASDVRSGPLKQAKRNIDKYNCDIKVKLGYGISTIESDVDTVVIAGMGGDTIVDILNNDSNLLVNVEKMVLSPQSEWMKVRKVISSLGFYISNEVLVEDGTKFYFIIEVKKGYKDYNDLELEYGPLLLKNKSLEFLSYYKKVLAEERKVLEKIPKEKIEEYKNKEKEINILKNMINE